MGNMKEFLSAMQRTRDWTKYRKGEKALNKFDKAELERNLNKILNEINKIQDGESRSNLLSYLSKYLNNFKMFDKSLQIINTIPVDGTRGFAYSQIAVAFASIGEYKEAVKLMKKAKKLGSVPQWVGLIKQAVDLQDFADAEEIAKNIDSLDEQSRQLKIIRAHKNRYCPLIKEDDELFVVVSNELAKNLRIRSGDKATIRIM